MAAQFNLAHTRPYLSRADATPASAPSQTDAGDLWVSWVGGYHAAYESTRAVLEAEGLIPAAILWPVNRAAVRWQAHGLGFVLRRAGAAGEDRWRLHIELLGKPPGSALSWRERWLIDTKTQTLIDEIHRQSASGRREEQARWGRYWTAHEDQAFRAFLDPIVSAARVKPGQKATSSRLHAQAPDSTPPRKE